MMTAIWYPFLVLVSIFLGQNFAHLIKQDERDSIIFCEPGDYCGGSPEDNLNVTANGGIRGEYSELKNFTKAAVACDAPLCSEISKSILAKGGAIADAAIAGMLCMGVVHPQSSGIGGGLVAVFYNATTRESTVLSARETAPAAANESMFDNFPAGTSSTGGMAIAVPAEIKGFMELYTRFGGKVSWLELFEPSIDLLEKGYPVDSHLAGAFKSSESFIRNDPSLRSAFFNEITDNVYVEGDVITNPALAVTLKTIAEEGGQAFYNLTGFLASTIVEDLMERGGIMTPQDLEKYTVQIQKPVTVKFDNNLTLFTAGPPSSGASKAFVLRILQKFKESLKPDDINTTQILIEAYKFAYGRRGKFGDPDDPTYKKRINGHVINLTQNEEYLNKVIKKIRLNMTSNEREYYLEEKTKKNTHAAKDSGTAHFAIVGENGDAISVTTTIGKYFGAKVRSPVTGIIFNNKMNNFLINPKTRDLSPANKIAPGKRPMNTAVPSVYVDDNGTVRLAIGGAGGMKIISSVTFSTMNHLFFGKNIQESISARRVHHALRPMLIEYEPGYNKTVMDKLANFGHKTSETKPVASVVGISRDVNGQLWATWDPRKPGSADGI